MTSEGNNAISTVSVSRSNAHMPRVILRTVEPAKLLACQSVEKRCRRAKASCATSLIVRSVMVVSPRKAKCRPATVIPASASIATSAARAASAWPAPFATASTRRPA
jgi:hypothetical protein